MEQYRSRVPWSVKPSLKEKARESGVEFDRLIELLGKQQSDTEMASELGVSEELVRHLRDHFERYGVSSVMGQD